MLLLSFTPLQDTPAKADAHRTIVIETPSGAFTTMHYGDDVRVPYLWPVRGPGGVEMTRAFPMEKGRGSEGADHPHHTSLWFAHGSVNDYDFWHSKARYPRIVVIGEPKVERDKDGTTTLETVLEWRATAEAVPLREVRRTTFAESNGVRTIDFDLRLVALTDVRFGDTKEGTFAMRLRPELRLKGRLAKGSARDADGRKDDVLWGKRSRWLTYYGPVGERTVGVAVFDHSKNLRHPTWWHARDYGLVAANPFGIHDFERKPAGTGDLEIAKGDELRLRYRVTLFEGTPKLEDLDAAWRKWSK